MSVYIVIGVVAAWHVGGVGGGVCVRGQSWRQEQGHNTCDACDALASSFHCLPEMPATLCVWVESGPGQDACYRFSGLATNHPKSRLESKLNNAFASILHSPSLSLS